MASNRPGNGNSGKTSSGHHGDSFLVLALGSIGVVYGDIGTSPLYAFREAIMQSGGVSDASVYGVLSLIFWALIFVVTAKYVLFILRADNSGEGGILSLMALAQRAVGEAGPVVLTLGVIGACMFYGDAAITPAISVLSAVEGLELATPVFDQFVELITVFILIALFMFQKAGTGKVAGLFGPITLVWFLVMAAGGVFHIIGNPAVLFALDPLYGVKFLFSHHHVALPVLGAVFLAVTGAEALYADLGHFRRGPIQAAWAVIVLPCLALNYFGQGALVLGAPETIENPFFKLYSPSLLLPMVGLATAATVIASQAVITGAYSLTNQAVQLGLLPRMEIRHTSESQHGQIYMPKVNYMILAGVILLVLLFRSSSALASAYGIAVTTTMVVTTMLAFIVSCKVWNWKPVYALAVILPFFVVDLTFLWANALKIPEGGWVPIMIAGVIGLFVYIWIKGTRFISEQTREQSIPLHALGEFIREKEVAIVPGTGIYLTNDLEIVPLHLLANIRHHHSLHNQIIIMNIKVVRTPNVSDDERIEVRHLDRAATIVIARFGYNETPSLPKILKLCREQDIKFDVMSTSFFVGRRFLRSSPTVGMPGWQDRIYIGMSKNAVDPADFFQIPVDRVVEVGVRMIV